MDSPLRYRYNISLDGGKRDYFFGRITTENVLSPPTAPLALEVTSALLPLLTTATHRMLGYAYIANVLIGKGSTGAEIGVDVGDGLRTWLTADPGKIFAVDPWERADWDEWFGCTQCQMDERYKNVLDCFAGDDRVEIIRMSSADWFETSESSSLDWCHIDGDHREDGCYQDLCSAHRCVKGGGYIFVDDTRCRKWRDGIALAMKRFEQDGHRCDIVYANCDPVVLRVIK